MAVAVTGGAGYIGAHVVAQLAAAGETVIVIDDLSTSDAARVDGHRLLRLDVADPHNVATMAEALREHDVDGVIHFAARKQVGESVQRPVWYCQQNVGGLANVLDAMERSGVRRIIFSSTASAYGEPDVEILTEDLDPRPINPYGWTKIAGERLMADCERAWGLSWLALRYFNAAGAGAPELGDPAIMNLIPMVFDRLERGEQPAIFGEDYPTPDGTCVRDYVHVRDLARAHVMALARLRSPEPLHQRILNVATGRGSSVREVLRAIQRVTGRDLTPTMEPRRPGDPHTLVASPVLAKETIGFETEAGLDEIVQSAWEAWRYQHDEARP